MSSKGQILGLVFTSGFHESATEESAWNRYHGKPQLYYVFDQLSEFCSKVFIVCDKIQKNRIFSYYPTIVRKKEANELENLRIIFNTAKNFPDTAILTTSTDFPMMNRADLAEFMNSRSTEKPTIFFDRLHAKYQPAISFYPAQIIPESEKEFNRLQLSAQEFFDRIEAAKFFPGNETIFNQQVKRQYFQAGNHMPFHLVSTNPYTLQQTGLR